MATAADSKPVSVEAKPAGSATATLSVFSNGPYTPKPITVKTSSRCFNSSPSPPPKPLFIVFPDNQGKYEVILFFPGTSVSNTSYSKLFDHLASHGYIVVSPQLYNLMPPKGNKEVDAAAEVINWLPKGLQSHLPENVVADLNYSALMGHSRGGLTAFALAQGYATNPPLGLKFSALVGVDPVAGIPYFHSELDPPILDYESFNFSIPVTVIGTGLGGLAKCVVPCAPEKENHQQFFNRCTSSDRAHFDATYYGHMDVLDDCPPDLKSLAISKCMCTNGTLPRQPMRQCVGGIAVAFLEAYFDSEGDDFKTILADPSVAPITLGQVEFIPAPSS